MTQDTKTKVPLTPEAEANTRINGLQDALKTLEAETKITRGRLKNLAPENLSALREENATLKTRLARMERALFVLTSDLFKPRSPEDLKNQFETLRQGAVEFCTRENVNPEIWKSIVS